MLPYWCPMFSVSLRSSDPARSAPQPLTVPTYSPRPGNSSNRSRMPDARPIAFRRGPKPSSLQCALMCGAADARHIKAALTLGGGALTFLLRRTRLFCLDGAVSSAGPARLTGKSALQG